MLVGFQKQGNLGLGYLASMLRAHGHHVEIVDFEDDSGVILARARACNAAVIGFSLIFQFYIHRFGDVIRYLRANGVAAHFTMGGHFPSLSAEETLRLVPGLDSVVRFEGELTLLELVAAIGSGADWRSIAGISFAVEGKVVHNPLRHLVVDLDSLPYPDREYEANEVLGCPIHPILASRGCARTCSFCSIHMFYRSVPGKVVRTRKPAEVVREMRALHEQRGARIFLFQDDDFPIFGPVWHRWAREFVAELHAADLPGRVVWKINCRADVVETELFTEMREAGLYLVYMGLESGSEDGLKTLNKKLDVGHNLRAVELLKSLDITFDYGFMLFDPSTTFTSIRENVAFLRSVVGDGSAAATFCRMIPYDGTPIKDELIRQGRFHGDVCNPDYDFLDPRLAKFYAALSSVVDKTGWIHEIHGLSPMLAFMLNELAVLDRLFPQLDGFDEYRATVRAIGSAANEAILSVVERMADAFEHGRPRTWSTWQVRDQCAKLSARLLAARNGFVRRHQPVLLETIERFDAVVA